MLSAAAGDLAKTLLHTVRTKTKTPKNSLSSDSCSLVLLLGTSKSPGLTLLKRKAAKRAPRSSKMTLEFQESHEEQNELMKNKRN